MIETTIICNLCSKVIGAEEGRACFIGSFTSCFPGAGRARGIVATLDVPFLTASVHVCCDCRDTISKAAGKPTGLDRKAEGITPWRVGGRETHASGSYDHCIEDGNGAKVCGMRLFIEDAEAIVLAYNAVAEPTRSTGTEDINDMHPVCCEDASYD